tara:strand:- start:622 stop:1272 length:651 start_codon:yes stop_codon:yes gene_type:complete
MTTHEPFDFSAIEDFDAHISLSIPNYSGLMDVFTALFLEYMPPKGKCIDIGCSTGSLLNSLCELTEGDYIGVDNVRMAGMTNTFTFKEEDCIDYLKNLESADIIISSFTLQFLGKHKRVQAVNELTRLVKGGATLLVAEKVYYEDAKVNTVMWREHIRQKRKAFTDTEILDKDYSLFGSMFCETQRSLDEELKSIGLTSQVWQSYNFKGFIITPRV